MISTSFLQSLFHKIFNIKVRSPNLLSYAQKGPTCVTALLLLSGESDNASSVKAIVGLFFCVVAVDVGGRASVVAVDVGNKASVLVVGIGIVVNVDVIGKGIFSIAGAIIVPQHPIRAAVIVPTTHVLELTFSSDILSTSLDAKRHLFVVGYHHS